jgi:prepilin-type N-terminal cleavage/methylation domain-containing protein
VKRHGAGFTLIEVLVVLSLMGVLMGIGIGLIQRIGAGNLLIQTTNALASLLASARSQSHGNDSSYVLVEADPRGETQLRSFRSRQVFHWSCEDFERASAPQIISKTGNVDIATDGIASGEGNHIVFSGGNVSLGNAPWLQLVDGFSFKCRLKPDAGSSRASARLFEKGQAIAVSLLRGEGGRWDVDSTIRLLADEEGEGAGPCQLKTGFRDGAEVPEWGGPILSGRWQDVHIAYDRNTFAIWVNGRLRAVRTDRRNRMRPDTELPFLIGDGFFGGFDSLLLGGIFEEDEDKYEVNPLVSWIDAAGKPIEGQKAYVHFRNRGLDARLHAKPVVLRFRLSEAETPIDRTLTVSMSGETFMKRPGE